MGTAMIVYDAIRGKRCGVVASSSLLILLASGMEAEESVARQWNEELLNAIRLDTPAPTVHGRNLFHLSVAMYDAWAVYDGVSTSYLNGHESADAVDVEAAREEAISFAAYRILKERFSEFLSPPGFAVSQASFDALMAALGYDSGNTTTAGDSPAALGNRIAETVLSYGLTDGGNEAQAYIDTTGYAPFNDSLVFELSGTVLAEPNHWQPLSFDFFVLQNGIIIGEATQEFIGPHWGAVKPFALERDSPADPYTWSPIDPGPPPQLGGVGDARYRAEFVDVIRYSTRMDPDDGVRINLSPAVIGNRPLGTHLDRGYTVNPVTGMSYAANIVKRGDYGRVLAEFWADGPDSETPPGHWNTIANYVSDDPLVEKRIGGEGPVLSDLEWDVKLYFALNGAVHDAAVAAWGAKSVYDYVRPISAIRHMAGLGQSSDPDALGYDPFGLPLEANLIELITAETTAPGGRHQHLSGYEGEIAIRAWIGQPADPETQYSGVGWIRGVEWLPYQRSTFVTPSFAAYVSGHSTFSRAAAEVLTRFTGNSYFPGGLGTWEIDENEFLEFEIGPTEQLTLQWATYFDAADEAGISRLYGGIHLASDDFKGRIMGSLIGIRAYEKAMTFLTGAAAAGVWRLTYDEWKSDHLVGSTALTEPYDDAAGNGLLNLEKFAFGIDPFDLRRAGPGYPHLTVIEEVDGQDTSSYLALVFEMPERMPDVGFILEVSSDLQTWVQLPWVLASKTLEPVEGKMIRVTVRDMESIENLIGSRFLRMRLASPHAD
jgi:hypothetical protein